MKNLILGQIVSRLATHLWTLIERSYEDPCPQTYVFLCSACSLSLSHTLNGKHKMQKNCEKKTKVKLILPSPHVDHMIKLTLIDVP